MESQNAKRTAYGQEATPPWGRGSRLLENRAKVAKQFVLKSTRTQNTNRAKHKHKHVSSVYQRSI